VHVVFCFIVLVDSTSAIDCLERLVSEMTYMYCVEWDVSPTHSLILPTMW